MAPDPYAQPPLDYCGHLYGIQVRADVSDAQRLQALMLLMERAPANEPFRLHRQSDYSIQLDAPLDVYTVRW